MQTTLCQRVMSVGLMTVLLLMPILAAALEIQSPYAARRLQGELRDPFKPLIGAPQPTKSEPLPAEIAHPNPLTQFELRQLQVTGILLGGLGDYATLRAPDGKTYLIVVGATIGKQGGTVTAIESNGVHVNEVTRYWNGSETTLQTTASTLKLDPLASSAQLESRFVVISQ